MEATMLYRGLYWRMEKKMETTVLYASAATNLLLVGKEFRKGKEHANSTPLLGIIWGLLGGSCPSLIV